MTLNNENRNWYIVSRWQEFEGETRANLLRLVALASFYVIELINYYGLNLGPIQMERVAGVDRKFHLAMTAIVVAWAAISMGVTVCLRAKFFPAALKYVSTAGDALLLTCVLLIADGPKSPLLVCYFLVIVIAGLRFSLGLVWFASAASLLGYIVVIGNAAWYRQALRVPRYQELVIVIALALTGIFMGQIIRRVRKIASDFSARTFKANAAAP